jgi:hypothetical protein
MKIRDLVNFDMLFPNMQRKMYLRDLVFEIFMIEFRPIFDNFLNTDFYSGKENITISKR